MTDGSATFGDLLRRHRLAAGLTQEELAERAQVSPRAISDLERGLRTRPWRDTIEFLATALELGTAERAELEVAARRPGPPSADPLHREVRPDVVGSRTNLPSALTRLIGRERETARTEELLRRADVRLVTLTGPGGIGKTRLALQVAANVSEEFLNGAYFVPLAPISAATSVMPTIAQVVGVKESADQPLIEGLSEALRGRQMLLVLDNFEHVVAAAGDVAAMLVACPKLKILVTSRSPLHLRGEHESPVPPLSIPDRDHPAPPNQLLQSEAVRLFVERARAVRPDFTVTDQNAAAVAEICRHVDGLPLAIELAAARIKVLSPADLLDRLGARLRILTGGARDLPARHQTLRSTIGWSYQLLSEEEQRLFRRLAVLAGGFTLESAAVVGGGATIGDAEAEFAALDLLGGLVDKSLIQRDASSADATRFTMLETIREYAREMLTESGEVMAIARVHASYFHTRVVVGESIATMDNSLVPVTWLERERHNLLAALRWFRDEGDAAAGLRLAEAVWSLWYGRGPRSEGREWLATFLRLTAGGPRTIARASALHSAGLSAIGHGEPAAARADLEEGLAIARELGDRSAELAFLRTLVMMEKEFGNLAAARSYLQAALALQRTLNKADTRMSLLIYAGDLAHSQGDDALARSSYEESLAIGIAPEWALRFLGYTALLAGDLPAARVYLRDSLDKYRKLDLSWGQMECLNGFAGLALAQERWEAAGRLLGVVEALQRTLFGGRLHGRDRLEYERFLTAARAALSAEGFALAWAEGQAMTLEQAIAYALEDEDT